MRTTSYSAFRRNLAATLDSVTDDGRGKPAICCKARATQPGLLQAAAALDEGGGAERGLTQ